MTGIVDYNAGNIKSVERALDYLKVPFVLSKDPRDLEKADRLIFPGVGDAAYAMTQLKKSGFDSFLKDWASSGKDLLGICLGSQIVFDYSEEGDTKCLGLLPGIIKHFDTIWAETNPSEKEKKESDTPMLDCTLKVPHMGWNDVTYCNGSSRLMDGVPDGSDFYFVHSYVIHPDDPEIIKGYATYETMVPAIVEKDNITVFQFHPEKSGHFGLQILKNYVKDDMSGGNGSC